MGPEFEEHYDWPIIVQTAQVNLPQLECTVCGVVFDITKEPIALVPSHNVEMNVMTYALVHRTDECIQPVV
jgi:hypothetical protein